MSRRDVPKNPLTGKYNAPKPGEKRPGNKNKKTTIFLKNLE
jgi:hypothetical protein